MLGAVLVGGASRRMGRDKATIGIAGRPLSRRAADALVAGGAASVVLVGAGRATVELTQLAGVADRWPGAGPLGGLATAVDEAAQRMGPDGIVVVAACDQPDLTGQLIRRLVGALAAAPPSALAAVPLTADGRRHPFPSAWRSAAAEALVALVEAGHRRADAPWDLAAPVEVEADAAEVDDLDDPADLDRWLRRSDGEGRGEPRGLS